MTSTQSRVLLTLASILAVLCLVWWDTGRSAPGPLSAVHEREADLQGAAGCAACHEEGEATLADGCLVCHEAIGEQLVAGGGLHATWDEIDARDCGSCHVEHLGSDFSLVGDEAFLLAGLGHREEFDHRDLEFRLSGSHDDLDCSSCHEEADANLLPRGSLRFIGLEQDCAACHEDPHEGTYTSDCASCHGQVHPFDQVAEFDHGEAFPLLGAHLDASCLACHARDEAHSIESLLVSGRLAVTGSRSTRACDECHPSAHRESFVIAVGRIVGGDRDETCARCHDASHGTFLGETVQRSLDPALHAASGFPLEAPHERLACDACHDPEEPGGGIGVDLGAAASATEQPGRRADDCRVCHGDPHRGEFDSGPFETTRCLDCHDRKTFDPPLFGPDEHARTGFALTGSHAREECGACHLDSHDFQAGEEQDRHALLAFGGLASECAGCHRDAHAGAFVASGLPPSIEGRAGCARCHSTNDFGDEQVRTAFDHDRWTPFALEGAHARASCEACHEPSSVPDETRRTFGFAAGTECTSCHSDPHDGVFQRPGLRALAVVEGAECARCHSVETFDDVDRSAFEHGVWTPFPIDGAHEELACAACHEPLDVPEPSGRLAARAAGAECASCHQDVHRGAFDERGLPELFEGRRGCARCHDTGSFQIPSDGFDHGIWTGYPLDGAHARASCSGCHGAQQAGAPHDYALASAAPDDCASCHDDSHAGQFRQRGRTDCSRCHSSTESFAELSFDHDRDSRFALDKDHSQLECAACHRPVALAGGGQAVRYRPMKMACADCHEARRSGTSGEGGL